MKTNADDERAARRRRHGRLAIAGLVAALVFGALGSAVGSGSSAQPGAPGGVAKLPVVQWAGHDTQRRDPGFVVVANAAAWDRLWEEHTGDPIGAGALHRNKAPKVDFERCVVVAYYRGPSTNRDGETVRDVLETDGRLRVRFVGDTFQTSGPGGGAVKTRPFGIWVLPRTGKPIVIEEGRHGLKDEPLRWGEVASFAAP